MLFKHKDGELRIYDRQSATTGFYFTVLFTDANLNFPLGRAKAEESLDMDRGKASASMSYSMGSDDPIFAPMDLSVTANMNDQASAYYLRQLLSGTTVINGHTLHTHKGYSSINVRSSAVSTMSFADSSKTAYQVEVLWDGATDYGYQIREVYFPPNRQTVNEGADKIPINLNGLIYGDVSAISSFSGGSTIETAA